jgi:hypothetical protein
MHWKNIICNIDSNNVVYPTIYNNKFWEELYAYLPFIIIWVSDMTRRKKTLVCMCNEVNKTRQFGRLQFGITDESALWCTLLEMASDSMIYVSICMKIALGSQIILRFCLTHLKDSKCWYYWWMGFMVYAIEMASSGMIYIPSSVTTGSGI